MLLDNRLLKLLDFFVEEFDYLTGIHVDHVVVVTAVSQFEYSMTAIKVVAYHKACCFKLGQNTVNRGQTDILASFHQRLVNILGTHVSLLGGIEHL